MSSMPRPYSYLDVYVYICWEAVARCHTKTPRTMQSKCFSLHICICNIFVFRPFCLFQHADRVHCIVVRLQASVVENSCVVEVSRCDNKFDERRWAFDVWRVSRTLHGCRRQQLHKRSHGRCSHAGGAYRAPVMIASKSITIPGSGTSREGLGGKLLRAPQ